MNPQDSINLDGKLAYLGPKGVEWKPLSEIALLSLLPEPETKSRPLKDDEKNKLSQNRQHVNDTLLKSLQMPNLSFFAGSGTSLAEVNGPSMWNLWERSMLESSDEDEKRLKKDAQETMEKVKYTDNKNPNIEHFLSQCDAYLMFNEDKDVERFLNMVKEVILHECSTFLESSESDISSYHSLMQKLARRRVRDPRLKVFTTNYDMCFETAASDLGMMIVDGFSYTRKRK